MRLNSLRPAKGSKKIGKRLGRGIGSGRGKTSGHGHKGQKARAGGYHKVGFEGGQAPMQRRIPKSGFVSLKSLTRAEVYLSDLERLTETTINLDALIEAGVVPANTKQAKVIGSGKLTRKVIVQGILVTSGARQAIEALQGTIE